MVRAAAVVKLLELGGKAKGGELADILVNVRLTQVVADAQALLDAMLDAGDAALTEEQKGSLAQLAGAGEVRSLPDVVRGEEPGEGDLLPQGAVWLGRGEAEVERTSGAHACSLPRRPGVPRRFRMTVDKFKTYFDMSWPLISGILLGAVILVAGWLVSKWVNGLVRKVCVKAKVDEALARFFAEHGPLHRDRGHVHRRARCGRRPDRRRSSPCSPPRASPSASRCRAASPTSRPA